MFRHGPPGQQSFSLRPQPRGGRACGKKTARTKWCIAPLRRGLADAVHQSPQPYGGPEIDGTHRRFAWGKPSGDQGLHHHRSTPTGTAVPKSRPMPHGWGRSDFGTAVPAAIQPRRLAWDGLEGAARPSISMRFASKGMAIGRGFAPERSHANLGATGEEFA